MLAINRRRDSRWDIAYLGMQIVIESLALAAFGGMLRNTEEPLLKKLLRYVMSDEARHVAFGVLTLKEVYADFTAPEIRERQEFCYEAAEERDANGIGHSPDLNCRGLRRRGPSVGRRPRGFSVSRRERGAR